jgi:ATP:ADP antiporter, AAA family
MVPMHSEPAWIARCLRPITIVLPGEAISALLMTLNLFLLLMAYYIIKPVREALILAMRSGAEYKSYLSAVIALALLFAVPAYAKFVDRLPRIKLVMSVNSFFAANLLMFILACQVPSFRAHLGLVFYCWVGIFNMMVVAQFWSFANDIYSEEQGTRLFPMVAVGGSVGAAVGSKLVSVLIRWLGVPSLLLVATLVLLCCAVLYWLIERRQATNRPEPIKRDVDHAVAGSGSGAFGLVMGDRYLGLVAAFSLLFTWVNSNGEYLLGRLVREHARQLVEGGRAKDIGEVIGATYADFFFYVNLSGVLLQTFVVARVVRWCGFRMAFLLFPLAAIGDAACVALIPILSVIAVGKSVENSLDYSLNNTLRQMLWLVTSRDVKYKAKQAIDTFFVRMGDVSSAVAVWLGVSVLAFGLRYMAWLNVLLAATWSVIALAIGREHQKRVKSLAAAVEGTG